MPAKPQGNRSPVPVVTEAENARARATCWRSDSSLGKANLMSRYSRPLARSFSSAAAQYVRGSSCAQSGHVAGFAVDNIIIIGVCVKDPLEDAFSRCFVLVVHWISVASNLGRSYSTRRSLDSAIADGEDESSSAPLTVR